MVPDMAIDSTPEEDQLKGARHTKWIVPEECEVIDVPEETVEGFNDKLVEATGGRNIGSFKVEKPDEHAARLLMGKMAAPMAEDEFEADLHGLKVRGKKGDFPKTPGKKA